MNKLFRVFKFAFQNIGRNLWLSIMTIIVLTVTLFSVNILLALNVTAASVTSAFEDKIDVAVYLVPNATDDQVTAVRSYLAGLPQVSTVTSISPDEALAKFKDRHKDDADVLKALDEVGDNPLGTTLVVKAKSLDQYQMILTALDNPAYKDLIAEKNFEDYRSLVDRVENIQGRARDIGTTLLIIFALIAVIIMVNSVRVAIFTHKDEIGIMKLVGASGMFIRLPFVIESLVISLLALIISSGIAVAALYFGSSALARFLGVDPGLTQYFINNVVVIAALEYASIAVLTSLASIYAVGRYMKV
jgi:cell division transport system permease protein